MFGEADLDMLFSFDAKDAVISESGLTDRPCQILFDSNSVDNSGVLTDKPALTIKTADLEGFTRSKAVITVNGTGYTMIKPLDDGAGLTVAGLKREQ